MGVCNLGCLKAYIGRYNGLSAYKGTAWLSGKVFDS